MCSAVTLASVAASAACDFIRPPDPLEAHLDVVTVSIMLVAGESEARLLAVHPHRPRDAGAPEITATLEGPGWKAPFSEQPELETCTSAADWPGPVRCLGASLPEPVRAGTEYRIGGTAPLGSFKGVMTMPAAPDLLDPGDSLELTPEEYTDVRIPMRYRRGADVGTLLADALEAFQTQDDGTEVELDLAWLFPLFLHGEEADTVEMFYDTRPTRFSLRLLGIGWNYTNFRKYEGTFPLPKPWPSFGIEGEGVYGYFDGLTASRVARVRLR